MVLGAPTLGGEAGGESDTCEVVSHEAWEKVEVAHEAWDEMDPIRLREEGVTGVAAPVGGIWDRLNLPLSLPMGDWDPIRRRYLAIAASPSLPHVLLPVARAVSHKAAPSAEEARFLVSKASTAMRASTCWRVSREDCPWAGLRKLSSPSPP